MEMISVLVFDAEEMPSAAALQAESQRAGEAIEFGGNIDLTAYSGFLPVRVQGRDTGFLHYFGPLPEDKLPPNAARFGSHHSFVRTGGGLEDGRAALIFLRAAARLTGAAYVSPVDRVIVTPEHVDAYLGEQINVFEEYLSNHA